MPEWDNIIEPAIRDSIDVKTKLLAECREQIISCAELMVGLLRSGGKLLLCGNGGSAAEAQHFTSELMGRLWKKERPPIAAIAMTTDTSLLTALSNDFGFDECFARQVEGLGAKGDVLIGLTTSGKSPNIKRAVERAKSLGISTIGLLGGDGGEIKGLVDKYILVPSDKTPRIQECHHMLTHILASIIESEMYG